MIDRPRRLGRDVSLLSWGYLGRSVAYLCLTIALTRTLGPGGFGQLSLFLALGYGLSYLAGSWPFLALPILVGGGWRMAEAFRPAVVIAVAGTTAGALIMLPIATTLLSGSVLTLALLVVFAVSLVGLQALYAVLQTQGRMAAIALTQTCERALALAIVLVLALFSTMTVTSAEAGITLAACVLLAARLTHVARSTALLRGGEREGALRAVYRAVGPMAVVTACSYVVAWVDLLILAAFESPDQVGIYALAYQIYTFVTTFGTLWIVAALPAHAEAAAAGTTTDRLLAYRPTRAATGLWSVGVAAVAVGCALLLPHVFGPEFRSGTGPLMVLLAGAAPVAAYFAAVAVLLALRRARELAVISVGAVAVNVGLNFALIPTLGIWGPAIATAAQSVLSTMAVLVVLQGRRALRIGLTAVPALVLTALLAYEPSDPLLLSLVVILVAVVGVGCARDLAGLRAVFAR